MNRHLKEADWARPQAVLRQQRVVTEARALDVFALIGAAAIVVALYLAFQWALDAKAFVPPSLHPKARPQDAGQRDSGAKGET